MRDTGFTVQTRSATLSNYTGKYVLRDENGEIIHVQCDNHTGFSAALPADEYILRGINRALKITRMPSATCS